MHRAKTKLQAQNVMRCNRKRRREWVYKSKIADGGGKTQWKLEITTHFGQTESTLKYVIRELVICVCKRVV